MRTIFYARVSTAEQTLSHQQTQAEKAGYVFDMVIADDGVSGVSVKLRDRPQGRRLFDLLNEGDTLVVRWIDRLGRNYADVTDTIREFIRRGVVVRTIINGMVFDGATQDPMQEAIRGAQIAFMAAMAQAQAEGTKDAQRAGIDAAKDAKNGAYRGRKPSYDSRQLEEVVDLVGKGIGIAEVARTVGVTRQTVYRIKNDEASARKTLATWTN
ncbi:recombinase family protein [Aurantimonas sp. A2-1-M11]|uniref:recombinase family protein n=1 Tax=Aurantimonas sp. A2-1-M11 TaxID=3113712 RepID=UPI002F922590